jgi:hypothetical protein
MLSMLLNSSMSKYEELQRFGTYYSFDFKVDNDAIIETLKKYDCKWNQYNPRKSDIKRLSLSLVNLTGIVENGPDLDSLYEYNAEQGTKYSEMSFTVKTNLYSECLGTSLDEISEHIHRSHVIRLPPGGFFPIHRDARIGEEIKTFRLILPIEGCNPPRMYFLVDNQILNFEHGKYYFVDTCKPHVLFNASPRGNSTFAVFNVSVEAISKLGKWMSIR